MLRILFVMIALLAVLAPASGEEGKIALDRFFQGKITELKKDVVEITYDFSSVRQLEDFTTVKPFRADGNLEVTHLDRNVKLKGSGCFVLKALFTGLASIEFDMTPSRERDFGAIIAEDGQSDHFVLYSVNDLFFQKWDGGTQPGHMICRFGIIDHSEPKGSYAFRYVTRGSQPEIQRYKKIRLFASKDGKTDEFRIGDRSYKGKEQWREMPDMLVGVYAVKGGGTIDDVRIRGRLSPRWIKAAGVELALETPLGPKQKLTVADEAGLEKIKRYQRGTVRGEDLYPVIEDLELNVDVREQAAEALIASGNKSLVKSLVSLLYSNDLQTRKLAYDVLKDLAGRSFGYQAKSDADKRSKAIQKIVKHITSKKYAKEFE